MARKADVVLPKTKVVLALFQLLAKNGYLGSVEIKDNNLKLILKYDHKTPVLTDLNRISKPGCRVYVNKNHLHKVLGGRGIGVISTPFGLLTDKEARDKGVGGEVLCEVW